MDPPPPSELITLVRALPAAVPMLDRLGDGGGVHLVGGAVRELLLGGQPQDLDLVVVGDAAAVARRLGGELRAHDRFGTCTVVADGFTYDVAYARRETYAYPGALPVVEPASLFEDLRRRDFTVNAAAIALGGPRPGKLTAVPGALEDLPAHRLRVLHDLSFVDDPTRLLRLIRYQSRLRFGPVPGTRRLALAAVRGGALRTVSGARVGAELRLLAREQDPVAALHALRELALDSAIHPGFGLRDPPLARRALALLPGDGRGDLLALALCARGIGVGELADLLGSLAFRASERDTILDVVGRGDQTARALTDAKLPSEIVGALGEAGPELVALAGALGPEVPALRWLKSLRHVRLEIDGADLVGAGISPGPAIGRGLRAALAAKLDGLASGRDEELAHALRATRGR